MWWIIIIAAIIIMVIRFANDVNKLSNTVAKQGGMKIKYKKLIDHLLSSDPNWEIIQETGTSISVGASSISGSTVFCIIQSFGIVRIQYKVKSPLLGNHQLAWEFDEFADQDMMVEKITNDLGAYNKNMMQRFM